jgi:signal transduction histidine kinase/CheY-like chemotaxis protein
MLIATVAPLAILGWRSYLSTRRAVERTEITAIEDATRRTAESLDALVSSYIDGLRVQALDGTLLRAVSNPSARDAALDAMRRYVRVDAIRIESMALLSRDGRTIVSTVGQADSTERAPWFARALASSHPIVATAGVDRYYPTVAIIATQIRDASGTAQAVLRLRVRMAAFTQVMSTASTVIKRDGIIRLRDSAGAVISSWPYPTANALPPTVLRWNERPARFTVDAESVSENGVRSRTLHHTTLALSRLRESADQLDVAPWHLSVTVDEQLIMTPALAQARELGTLAVGLALVIAVLASFAGSRLSQRVERLTVVANRFADGELTSRAPEGGIDEIGELGSSFNAMADRVSGLVHTLEARTKQLEDDIAHRERLEAQLVQSRKLEAVGQLAGGVAHDFNNLLTVILSTTQLVAEALGPEHALLAELDSVESAARRGADMTTQLLTFARRQRVMPRVVDINEVVRESESLLRRLIGSRHALRLELAPAALVVRIDPTQFTQVLLNLASNARDAMVDRAGELHIECRASDAPAPDECGGAQLAAGSYVRITVSDTGRGMPADILDRVFEPFFTTKSAGEGTGLGLASVFGIVGQATGAIGVSSTLDVGTVFRLFLPRVDAEPEVLRRPPQSAESPLPRGLRLLAIDDDPTVQRAIVSPLLHRGVRCTTVGNADEGFAALTRDTFDVIVSDIMMPGRTGLEFVADLRLRHPTLPVLLISGYAPDWTAPDDLHTAFLAKPFTTNQLITAIAQLVRVR